MGYSIMFAFSKKNLFQISLKIVGYLKFMLKVFTLCEKYWVVIVNGLHYDSEKKLIKHQNVQGMSEFNIEIVRRGVKLIFGAIA